MKILFVDDERNPFGKLSEFAGFDPNVDDITWVKSSEEALEILMEEEWDIIFLDHDLGGDDTTMIIVQTVAELAFHSEIEPWEFAEFVIHTSNPVGRINLRETLKRWGFAVSDLFL